MSGGYEVLALKEDDVQKFLAAQVHIGDPNVDYQMAQYVYKVRQDGELLEFNETHVMYKPTRGLLRYLVRSSIDTHWAVY